MHLKTWRLQDCAWLRLCTPTPLTTDKPIILRLLCVTPEMTSSIFATTLIRRSQIPSRISKIFPGARRTGTCRWSSTAILSRRTQSSMLQNLISKHSYQITAYRQFRSLSKIKLNFPMKTGGTQRLTRS